MRSAGESNPNIAEALGRTVQSVENKIHAEKIPAVAVASVTPPPETRDAAYWRSEHNRLAKEVVALRKQQTATEILVGEAKSLAPTAYSAAPNIVRDCRAKVNGGSQSAVLMLSDTHVGAVVRPEQTLGFGGYNFPTFLRRLKRLEDSVISILNDHVATKIDELVIPIIGDVLDGSLTHGSEAAQINTVFSQFYGASHALSQFVRNLAAHVPKIRIFTCVGNHPRMPNQHKVPTKNRFSNLDHFCYAHMQALLRDIAKVEFNLGQQPMAEFSVRGYTFLAAHGDVLKGGDRALGIPSHAIGRAVSATSQQRAKCGRPAVNYFLYGHFHRAIELPHSGGRVLVNGGFPGQDEYGMAENFSAVPPVQKFFLVHDTFGISASYDLNLTFAKTEGIPYNVPGEFPLV